MGKVVGLNHAQITVPKSEEASARRFYCELLGLEEVEKPTALKGRAGLWLAVGDLQVHIALEDAVDRKATKAHLAYEVMDLAGWREVLEKEGVEIGESVPRPGFDRFEFRDSFGNRVEFVEPHAAP